jgi:hypothetical protein
MRQVTDANRARLEGHDTRAIQGWLGHQSITGAAVCTDGAEPLQRLLARSIGGAPSCGGERAAFAVGAFT